MTLHLLSNLLLCFLIKVGWGFLHLNYIKKMKIFVNVVQFQLASQLLTIM